MTMITNLRDVPAQKEEVQKQSRERRGKDRRAKRCEGYIYIDIVGWYCRRAQNRRKDD